MRSSAAPVLALLLLAVPATAQAPRHPRVLITLERGPLPARVLERAWPGRAFARCEADAVEDVVHLHVRIDPDTTVSIEHGILEGELGPAERCVIEVLLAARFPPQTEPTHAAVTVFFRPAMARDAQASRARQSSRAAPRAEYSSAAL
jgi:hypothetical protein